MTNRLKIFSVSILIGLVITVGVVLIRVQKAATNLSQTDKALLSAVKTNAALPTETVTIDGQTFTVQVAATTAEQVQGLSNRTSLASSAGMLFPIDPPSQPAFWMRDMNFPLDMIWVDQGQIVNISRDAVVPPAEQRNAPTTTYNPGTLVDNVLELNAGAAAHFHLGDRVTIASTNRL